MKYKCKKIFKNMSIKKIYIYDYDYDYHVIYLNYGHIIKLLHCQSYVIPITENRCSFLP